MSSLTQYAALAVVAGVPTLALLAYRRPIAAPSASTPFYVVLGVLAALTMAATATHIMTPAGTGFVVLSFWLAILFGGLLVLLLTALMVSRLFPPQAARSDQRKVILAVGAHPDDIEFGCGATLVRYREQGYETHGIVLTSGEHGIGNPRTKLDSRRAEANRAGRVMKLDSLAVLEFPDCKLISRRDEIKRALEEAITRLKPDLVFTHNRIDLHSDHRLVYAITIEACRNVPSIMCYENPNTPPEFKPSFFVDAATRIETKISALKCHASQSGKPYFKAELIRSMARVRGQQARLRFAEGFEVVRCRLGTI